MMVTCEAPFSLNGVECEWSAPVESIGLYTIIHNTLITFKLSKNLIQIIKR